MTTKLKFYSWSDEGIPGKAGIYILYMDKSIKKIYGIDKKGILYIGKSKNLKTRLGIRSREKWNEDLDLGKKKVKMFNHSLLTFAVDFDNNYNLISHSPYESDKAGLLKKGSRLQLKYSATEKKKEEETELKLLKGHLMLYGQLPPFNVKGPSLKSIWHEANKDWSNIEKFYKTQVNCL